MNVDGWDFSIADRLHALAVEAIAREQRQHDGRLAAGPAP
jgi:hypothetical protein